MPRFDWINTDLLHLVFSYLNTQNVSFHPNIQFQDFNTRPFYFLDGAILDPKMALQVTSKTTCTVCGKIFKKSCDLKRHLLIHSGEKPHACGLCGQRFRQAAHMRSHMNVHAKQKYTCDDCGSHFTRLDRFTRHQQNHCQTMH